MTVATTGNGRDQRARILALARDLMAHHGAAGVSMRRLAKACELNVATLYHYFPSKADLLRAVIAERNYDDLLRDATIPVDLSVPAPDRLVGLLTTIWRETLAERPVWRLLIGESLRGDNDALEVIRDLAVALEAAIERWLAESFPELAGARARTAAASVVTGQLLSFFLEDLVIPEADRPHRLARRAEATAAVVFPSANGGH